ncbi:hypothetical protein GCM10027168_19180 [Streptomyces capparidis]
MIRRLSYVFGGLSAAGAGGYLAVYLYRWEWQRALMAGTLLLVVEVFLVCLVLLGRIARLERRVGAALDPRAEDVRRRLAETGEQAGPPSFRWLEAERGATGSRTFVFVPVLLATGALLSGAAWLVQRLATATAGPAADTRLAGRLAVLAAPAGGVREAVPDDDLTPVLGPPPPGRGRRAALAAGALVALAALVVGLAELTQTRPEPRPEAEASSYLLKVSVRGDLPQPGRDLMAERLWASCRASTSRLLVNAPLSHVEGDVYAGVVRPALSPHDRMRLRGCLVDSQLDRVRFTVMGEAQIERG